MRIVKSQAAKLRGKREYVTVSTLKNYTLFTTSNFKDLAIRYAGYAKKYEIRQQTIVNKALEVTETYASVIELSIEVFSELDVLQSLAHCAKHSPAVLYT